VELVRNRKTILIGEDDPEVRNYLEMALKYQGYAVETARDGEEVVSLYQEHQSRISAILLDLIMPRKDGMQALREIRRINESVPVIVISGASTPLNVVGAMKTGATDFVGKPVSHDDLCRIVQDAIATDDAADVSPLEIDHGASEVFVSNSSRMRDLHRTLAQIGGAEVPVLITGETGAGKEVVARQLHAQSPRAKKPFLKLNCAALPSELVESELFGYDRGAFTGAFQRKPGMFELADQGTMLLDEIGDMDFKLQAKLLQVLQDHEFQRLGGKDTIRVDVRIIAATHCNLERSIAEGTFREDLYYRLNVIGMRIPPLRERADEIVPLAQFLLRKHTPAGKAQPAITPAMRQALMSYRWPGNVRELENVMRRFIIVRDAEAIASDLRAKTAERLRIRNEGNGRGEQDGTEPILKQVAQAKHQAERDAIIAALDSTRWNRKKAAAILRIDYKALLYKMKKLGIEDKAVALSAGYDFAGDEPDEIHETAWAGKA
jgi:two-component system, NtrC family, response regulator AtoC